MKILILLFKSLRLPSAQHKIETDSAKILPGDQGLENGYLAALRAKASYHSERN